MVLVNDLKEYDDELANTIKLGEQTKSKNAKIKFFESKSSIYVGNNTNITDTEISLGKGSKLIIGDNCVVKGKISLGSFSEVIIKDNLSVTHNLYIRAVECTKVHIGTDCLIASNVTIRTNDGHPIYDTLTHERINPSLNITINDHVWLGDEAAILKGVEIGKGSIVAMRSVVTKSIAEKTVVAGIPAKVIKSNCTWEHSTNKKTLDLYEPLEP